MAFESSVKHLEDGKVELSVTVDAAQTDAAVKATFKDLAKRMRIPGFRPGKAPRDVIEGQVGRDYVLSTALEKLVNDSYPLALDHEQLRIVGRADFTDPPELEEGAPYTYTVGLTVRQETPLTSTDVTITMPPREATEAEVNGQIEGTRERFATYPSAAKTAKIKKDSIATISFTSTIDGEEYEGSAVEKQLYHMGQQMMPPVFEEALVGKTAGDAVEVEFEVEPNGKNDEFVGKTMHFDVTVDAVNKKELPPIDDDFAVATGFDDLKSMRAEITPYINSQKEQSWGRVRNDRLLAALADKLDGKPAAELIEARTSSMIDEFSRMLARSKVSLEDYLAQSNIEPEQFREDMSVQAETSVKQDLALEALARSEGLEPDDKALDAEFEKLATVPADKDGTPQKSPTKTEIKVARERWEKQGLITMLRDDIARRRALEWLQENAKITIDEKETINA